MRTHPLRAYLLSPPAQGSPRRLTRAGWIVTALLIVLILSPLLFFPLGPDESAFYIGGSKILRGAVYYRDIIDVKPPLIHHLYALALTLFGKDGRSIMLLDLLLQSATCWLMIALVRRASGSDLQGSASAAIYAILYVGLNFQNVAQPESYLGLLGLAMTWLLLYRRTRAGFIAIGALAGALFLLKFTLGIMLAAVLLCEIVLFGTPLRRLALRCAELAGGFIVVASALPIYIIAHGVAGEFALMRGFTGGYARLQWGSPGEGLKNMLKMVAQQFSELYSIVILGATAAGIAASIPTPGERESATDGGRLLLRIATIAFALLLATVCIEGRYYPYQFSRIYSFGAILGAYGAMGAIRRIRSSGGTGLYRRMLIAAIVAGAILYGPLIRYGWWSLPMALRITQGEAGFDRYYSHLLDGLSRTELKSVSAYVTAQRRPGDAIFAASNVAGILYCYLDYLPELPILFSPSTTASFAPEEWRTLTSRYLLRQRPRFIITQRGDDRPDQTGSSQSSEQALFALPGIDSLMKADYLPAMHTDVFQVYQRREGR